MEDNAKPSASKDSSAASVEMDGASLAPGPKKRRRKWPIALGVVGAIVIVAGAGLWAWHETPSFCGTVCHDTMGSYLETYEGDSYMVADHAKAGVACLDCHEADIQTQIAELQVQMSGEYRLPLAKMETEDAFCLRSGCHAREDIVAFGESYTTPEGEHVNPHAITLASADKNSGENPHTGNGDTVACSTCHTAHRESKGIGYCFDSCHHVGRFDACSDCHDDK